MGKKKVMSGHPGVVVEGPIEEYCVKPVFDADGVQASSGIGVDGRELPDPVPLAPPLGYDPPPDLMNMIRTMVRHERFNAAMDAAGADTWAEANDFDVPDDPLDPFDVYEKAFQSVEEKPPAKPAAPAAASTAAASPAPENISGTPSGKPDSDTAKPGPGPGSPPGG